MKVDYTIVDGFDHRIDGKENGNSFIALRKIRWGDTAKEYLDLRKWFTGSDGNEIPSKGVSFMTEEGPSKLINVLIENDYGDTLDILKCLKNNRPDFNEALGNIDKEDDTVYYDPSVAIL